MNDNNSTNYAKWRSLSINKLMSKLQVNLTKRQEVVEFAVNHGVQLILQDNTVEIISNPGLFGISQTVKDGALNRMNEIICSWTGVDIKQCDEPPANWKKYWRLADNWWNRQKGKWFGDLFFWSIFEYNLHQFCKKINIHKETHYHAIYFIFVDAILCSRVSFKKSKPTPLIFDLALEKSTNLQQWFKKTGEQHGVTWNLSNKPQGESNHQYAQNWSRALKNSKYEQYLSFVQVNHNNNNNNNNNILLPLGQPALPEPVRSFVPMQPSYTRASNYYDHVIPKPINQFLPRPRRHRQLYYILEMKENMPLTQQTLDLLSQCSSIYTHISVDDTPSATIGGHTTPSTTPRSGISARSMVPNNGYMPSQIPQQRRCSSFGYPNNNNNNYNNYNNNNNNNYNNNNMIYQPMINRNNNNHHNNDINTNNIRLDAQCQVIGMVDSPINNNINNNQQISNNESNHGVFDECMTITNWSNPNMDNIEYNQNTFNMSISNCFVENDNDEIEDNFNDENEDININQD